MSTIFPPSEQRLIELKNQGIFPRSRVLEGAAALVGLTLGVAVRGERFLAETIQIAKLAFTTAGSPQIEPGLYLAPLISLLMIVSLASFARFAVVRLEARYLLNLNLLAPNFGRVFALSTNYRELFYRTKSAMASTVIVLALFCIGLFLGVMNLNSISQSGPALLVKVYSALLVIIVLIGAIDLFHNFFSFRLRYGMTREQLIAEAADQGSSGQLRAAIQDQQG